MAESKGVIGRCWEFLRRPSIKFSLLTLAGGGFAAGIGKRAGGQTGLVAIGLALWLFPTMWQTMDAAF